MANNARAPVTEYQQEFIPAQSNIIACAQEEENFMPGCDFELIM